MKEYKSVLPKLSLAYEPSELQNVKIVGSIHSAEFIRNFYFDDINIYESVFILLMNRSNRTIGYVKISQGGIAGVVVDVKLILKYAIESLASNVILAHNHPSGNRMPSDADKQLTYKVKEALKMMEIVLVDHIILTPNDGHYSFADEGVL